MFQYSRQKYEPGGENVSIPPHYILPTHTLQLLSKNWIYFFFVVKHQSHPLGCHTIGINSSLIIF